MDRHDNNPVSVLAVLGAMGVSGFITCVPTISLAGMAWFLPHGILRYIALSIIGILSAAFFLWFTRHAYKVNQDIERERINSTDRDLIE